MKEELNRYLVQIEAVTAKAISLAKKLREGYGYYISLACLLLLFGGAAYMYKINNSERIVIAAPENTSAVAVLANIESIPETTPSPTPYSPSFLQPVNGDIIDNYSPDELIWNETLGQWRVHNGIDIVAAAGTVVCASEDGYVSTVYEDELYGNTIEITHNDGWLSRYCSVENMTLAEVGAKVSKGDTISSVGSNSLVEGSEKPHLHFEILRNGQYIEPEFE